MTDVARLHRQALDATRTWVEGVRPEHLSLPTPNEGWDVRTLLNHVVSGNLWAVELARGLTIEQVGDRLEGDVLGDDVLKAYDVSAEAAAEAFEAPGALAAPCAVSYGPVPGEVYAGHRFVDVLVHGWDLASATSQDDRMPPDLVEGCFAVIEPQIDLLAASGAFADRVDPPAGSDRQTELLALLGRRRSP
jgi:uncharacterized protein (TIGR03086 family)